MNNNVMKNDEMEHNGMENDGMMEKDETKNYVKKFTFPKITSNNTKPFPKLSSTEEIDKEDPNALGGRRRRRKSRKTRKGRKSRRKSRKSRKSRRSRRYRR